MLKFGTDGIRAKANLLDEPFLSAFARAIYKLYGKISVFIARDTRVSGERIENALSSHFVSLGMDVYVGGIMPTPTLAYMTKAMGCNLGIMISASHNPPEYNGLKLFSGQGAKISLRDEKEIELALNDDFEPIYGARGSVCEATYNKYLNYLTSIFPQVLSGMRVLVDTCYGAASNIAYKVFKMLGAEVDGINGDSLGEKINVECGATCLRPLQEFCVGKKYDIAFAYDGDGDRVIAIKDGKVLSGDDIIYLIARYFELKGMLGRKSVVGTLMSNLGLELALKDRGIDLIRADVGDKYVYEKMLETGALIGGEDSGHIILKEYAHTGDGLITSLMVATIDREIGIWNLLDMVKYPVKEDFLEASLEQKAMFSSSEKIAQQLALFQKENGIRAVVRPSGTEPKLRIMVEGETFEKCSECAAKIKTFLSKELSININLENTKCNKIVSQNKIFIKEDYTKYTNNGVSIIDPNTTFIARGVVIGEGTTIYPFNYISGDTVIGKNVNLFPYCDITDTVIGDNVDIRSSYTIQARIGANSTIGPFATLRKGAIIGEGCRIGDYVEVKNATLGDGVKAAHLAYVGDASVGARTNVGCGTVFANYNGKLKRKTEVGQDVFIGCNSNLIAPLKIGDGCYIAGGSTITDDIPSGKFSIARSTQKTTDRR